MAALGINVSDRDPVKIFNNVPKSRAPLEVEYIKAQAEADRLWKVYCQSVDVWVENQMYNTMDEFEELCKQADLKAHMMYVKLNGVNVEDGE